MTDVRLDVLCDVVSLSGHSVDSSLYVGDVWYGCGWWWWRWRWLLHGGTEWMFVMWLALPRVGVVVCVKGWLREVGSEGEIKNSLWALGPVGCKRDTRLHLAQRSVG
jgi:hypothetical protein